jgi:hypothetical protein
MKAPHLRGSSFKAGSLVNALSQFDFFHTAFTSIIEPRFKAISFINQTS